MQILFLENVQRIEIFSDFLVSLDFLIYTYRIFTNKRPAQMKDSARTINWGTGGLEISRLCLNRRSGLLIELIDCLHMRNVLYNVSIVYALEMGQMAISSLRTFDGFPRNNFEWICLHSNAAKLLAVYPIVHALCPCYCIYGLQFTLP